MRVPLIREKTENTFKKAAGTTGDGHIHAGLLLDKGYLEEDENNSKAKTTFIKNICNAKADSFYLNAFTRWLALTSKNTQRFKQITMTLENRLLIGLSGTGALETGCAISHTNGMPYIPGSSIKGAVRNWARENLKNCEAQWTALFGSAPENEDKNSFSGLVTFHDAWWVPRSSPIANGGPFTQDIVTTHHSDYYGSSGEKKATDMDSPIPNALIGVHGSFLFVIEGDKRYLSVVETMLEKALSENGIGAKTSSGYGYLTSNKKLLEDLKKQLSQKDAENNFSQATLVYDASLKKVAVKLSDKRSTTYCSVEKSAEYMSLLGLATPDKKDKKKLKDGKVKVEVKVRTNGNQVEIIDLRPVSN